MWTFTDEMGGFSLQTPIASRIVATLLLCANIGLCTTAAAEEDDSPKASGWYYEQGQSHMTTGEYQQAAEAFKAALDRSMANEPSGADPKALAQWHAEQAQLHLREKEYLLAQSHAERAQELDPKNRSYKALASDASRAFEKQEKKFKQLTDLIQKAEAEEREGHHARALSAWKRAQALDKDDPRIQEGVQRMQARMDAKHPKLSNAAEMSAAAAQPKPLSAFSAEYQISTGDVIEVFVWQQGDLSRDVLVRPDGKISFPLVGDIAAGGLTLTQLDQELTGRLKTYIRFPDVSLAIKRFGGTKTIVLGEVGAPGVYVPTGQGGVLQVIAMAGGFTTNAAKKSVMLIRGGLGSPQVAKLNLQSALEEGKLEENVILEPNDIVYVPKGEIASSLDFMQQFYEPISQVLVGQAIATGFGARETSGGITR